LAVEARKGIERRTTLGLGLWSKVGPPVVPVRALLTERRRETARERRGPPVTLRGMESRR